MKKLFLLIIINAVFLIPNSFCGVNPELRRSTQSRTIDSLLTLLKIDMPDTNKVNHLNKLASEYLNISLYDTAKQYCSSGLQLALKLNFNKGITNSYNNIGTVYWNHGDYPKALDQYFKALKIEEKDRDKIGISITVGNIGLVYWNLDDYKKGLEYCFKALKISEQLGDKNGIARHLSNIGNIYFSNDSLNKALNFFVKALKTSEEAGNKKSMAVLLGNIGAVYGNQNEHGKALDYYLRALKMDEASGNKLGKAVNLANIGTSNLKLKKYTDAEKYLLQALYIDTTIGSLVYTKYTYEILSELYTETGNYKTALVNYKKAIVIKDTIFSQEKNKETIRKEMNYEFDKKEAAIKAENEKQQAVAQAESKKQKIIIWAVIGGLLLVVVFSGFIFRSLRITRHQKNIIELQKNEVSLQKEIVEKQKEKIVDSITYAQRIQQSILMEESEIQNYLPQSFIYFQPKDIVSGDFYWCSKIDDKIIIAAVDCTGHGVPGAFMSMIGNTLLNQIVNEKQITKPSEILRLLNLGVYEALHQKKDGALSDDGMDISLCCIDYKNNEVQYAGQNPLYILSDGKIEVIKGDIYGIGGGGTIAKIHDPLKKVFANHVIPIKEGMSISLSTDGFMDQFGGSDRKKYGTQRFKDLLLKNQHLNMTKQKELIASAHAAWKGNTVQIDDVLVIGIRI